jgi:hypothetical protein
MSQAVISLSKSGTYRWISYSVLSPNIKGIKYYKNLSASISLSHCIYFVQEFISNEGYELSWKHAKEGGNFSMRNCPFAVTQGSYYAIITF